MQKRTKREDRQREVYLNSDFGDVLRTLKPLHLELEFPSPTEAISIRLPRKVLNRIRIIADERDIPYQSLIKTWLIDRLKKAA